jgi:hypothetical protein
MKSDPNPQEIQDQEIIVDFTPLDEASAADIRAYFADDEVLESNSFIGSTLVTVILIAGNRALNKVLNYFLERRKGLKDATVKIGKDEISLSGYSVDEVKALIESGSVDKLVKEFNKGGKK